MRASATERRRVRARIRRGEAWAPPSPPPLGGACACVAHRGVWGASRRREGGPPPARLPIGVARGGGLLPPSLTRGGQHLLCHRPGCASACWLARRGRVRARGARPVRRRTSEPLASAAAARLSPPPPPHSLSPSPRAAPAPSPSLRSPAPPEHRGVQDRSAGCCHSWGAPSGTSASEFEPRWRRAMNGSTDEEWSESRGGVGSGRLHSSHSFFCCSRRHGGHGPCGCASTPSP